MIPNIEIRKVCILFCELIVNLAVGVGPNFRTYDSLIMSCGVLGSLYPPRGFTRFCGVKK